MEEALLKKVRALLAKAERTDNPHEAETFYAKATELMAKYSIDQAMLHDAPADKGQVLRKNLLIEDPYAVEKVLLLHAIGRANRVQVVLSHVGKRKIGTCFGFPADLEATELLFTSLLLHVVTEMSKITGDPAASNPGHDRWKRRTSFMQGFAVRIGDRLQEIAKAAEKRASSTHGASTAVVLADRAKIVEQALNEAFPKLGQASTSPIYHPGSFRAGQASANRADLGQRRVAPRRALQR